MSYKKEDFYYLEDIIIGVQCKECDWYSLNSKRFSLSNCPKCYSSIEFKMQYEANEKCSKCGRAIGEDKYRHIENDLIICAHCYNKLDSGYI